MIIIAKKRNPVILLRYDGWILTEGFHFGIADRTQRRNMLFLHFSLCALCLHLISAHRELSPALKMGFIVTRVDNALFQAKP